MKKILHGKLYDTDAADCVWDSYYSNRGDFNYRERSLYRTPKGNYFVHHVGGANTDMAVPIGGGARTGSEDIEVLGHESDPHTIAAVKEFLLAHDGDEKYLELFEVEEA